MKPLVGIIMGSDSDLEVMSEGAKVLDALHVPYELTIVSAHRTPDRMFNYAKEAKGKGIKVIIAGAGGAAHLPGMVAALTTLPVIGVPVKSKSLKGLDSLYSIVQMPPGVPVATMAINGAKNAGLLAASILAGYSQQIDKELEEYRKKMREDVLVKAELLENKGFVDYLMEY